MAKRQPKKSGAKKGRQHAHNIATGKYRRAFIRTVTRTGKWRGKKANVWDNN